MANEGRNALAELADALTRSVNILIDEGWVGCGREVFKAKRIIAELAKVEVYKGCITGTMHIGRGLAERFMKCREIAEEK